MADRRSRRELPTPPRLIVNPKTGCQYKRGNLLGKGGFAQCFELFKDSSSRPVAGKVVSKLLLTKDSQKEKMLQEIEIHRTLHHEHLVEFYESFEDRQNMYILLELCSRRSLMELHKRRKTVTIPEAQYFMRQIVLGCQYLHQNKVIHRDLKLGNVFLNSRLQVKIGDFGLATRINKEGERKKTLCGTPNYIAPEVLNKQGHSFEVDVWSLGCIVYTLVVGKPPFETQSLKDTYKKIRENDFTVPPRLDATVKNFICSLLRPYPHQRPNVFSMLHDPFFNLQPIIAALPESALTIQPRFHDARMPLNSIENAFEPINEQPQQAQQQQQQQEEAAPGSQHRMQDINNQQMLLTQLTHLLESHTVRNSDAATLNESEDPACTPIYWVSKWVDYSDKYGLGYQLSDNSVGVIFNDCTKLILSANQQNIQYYKKDNQETFFNAGEAPPATLQKKLMLLDYFRTYMVDHLLKAGGDMAPTESDKFARLPVLSAWFRTKHAMVLYLNNGILQLNFFKDHTKIIMCPYMEAVSFIDENKVFRTFRFNLLAMHGITKVLRDRMEYAKDMLERMLRSEVSGSGKVKPK